MNESSRDDSQDCREIFARLSEYLDHELDPAICAEFDRHMGACAPCVAFLASMRKTIELLGDQPPSRLPDEFKRSMLLEYESLRQRLDNDPGESA